MAADSITVLFPSMVWSRSNSNQNHDAFQHSFPAIVAKKQIGFV